MNVFIKLAGLSFLSAIPLGASAQTSSMEVRGEARHEERVSFADLDLRKGWDQRVLRQRVHAASDRVCRIVAGPLYETDPGGPGTLDQGLTCADIAYADAKPQIEAAIDGAVVERSLALSAVRVVYPVR